MAVMCSLLGVPAGAVPAFRAWVDAPSPVFGFMQPAQVAAATAAISKLLVGGHDDTASQTGCTRFTLLRQPGALKEIHADAGRLPAHSSETMRLEPSIAAAPRTVSEPIEIGGSLRPAGSVVMCSFLTANRDPEVWQQPEAFDPDRFAQPGAARLVWFGGGPHCCLGAALARMTLEEVMRGVSALAPSLSVDPGEIEWMQVLGRSPSRLPVAA